MNRDDLTATVLGLALLLLGFSLTVFGVWSVAGPGWATLAAGGMLIVLGYMELP